MVTLSDHVFHGDFTDRIPFAIGSSIVRLAAHLEGLPLIIPAEPVIAALKQGDDLSPQISTMKPVRTAFKKATQNGDWSKYAKMMDRLANQWGIFHCHADNHRMLVFVYLCARTNTAYVIDIRGHDKNWKVERELIGIVPMVITAKKFDPNSTNAEMVRSPHIMMIGFDPDDARPPWKVSGEHAGVLAARRRVALAQATVREREALPRHAARVLSGGRKGA